MVKKLLDSVLNNVVAVNIDVEELDLCWVEQPQHWVAVGHCLPDGSLHLDKGAIWQYHRDQKIVLLVSHDIYESEVCLTKVKELYTEGLLQGGQEIAYFVINDYQSRTIANKAITTLANTLYSKFSYISIAFNIQ